MGLEFFTGFEGINSWEEMIGFFSDVETYYQGTSAETVAFKTSGGLDDGKCIGICYWENKIFGYATINVTSVKTVALGFHIRNANYCPGWSSDYNSKRFYICKLNGADISLWNTDDGVAVYNAAGTRLALYEHIMSSGIHHVETKVYSNASAGTVTVKIDGLEIISLTGANTSGNDITSVTLGNTARCSVEGDVIDIYGDSLRGWAYFDNIYIADDLQGELASYLIKPESDDSVQWTPSTGADNYAMVDEVGSDGDTTYVETTTAGYKDFYEFEDLPGTVTTINGVSVVVVAKKVDPSGLTQVQLLAEQDASEYEVGDAFTLTTEYPENFSEAQCRVFSTCPDGTAWTPAKLNAIKWGIKAVA